MHTRLALWKCHKKTQILNNNATTILLIAWNKKSLTLLNKNIITAITAKFISQHRKKARVKHVFAAKDLTLQFAHLSSPSMVSVCAQQALYLRRAVRKKMSRLARNLSAMRARREAAWYSISACATTSLFKMALAAHKFSGYVSVPPPPLSESAIDTLRRVC